MTTLEIKTEKFKNGLIYLFILKIKVISPFGKYCLTEFFRSSICQQNTRTCAHTHAFVNLILLAELESLLTKVKEESEKTSLKFNIQKTKIMASCPITSWQIDGKTMEQ